MDVTSVPSIIRIMMAPPAAVGTKLAAMFFFPLSDDVSLCFSGSQKSTFSVNDLMMQ